MAASNWAGLQHRLIVGVDADRFENDQVFLRARAPTLAGNPTLGPAAGDQRLQPGLRQLHLADAGTVDQPRRNAAVGRLVRTGPDQPEPSPAAAPGRAFRRLRADARRPGEQPRHEAKGNTAQPAARAGLPGAGHAVAVRHLWPELPSAVGHRRARPGLPAQSVHRHRGRREVLAGRHRWHGGRVPGAAEEHAGRRRPQRVHAGRHRQGQQPRPGSRPCTATSAMG